MIWYACKISGIINTAYKEDSLTWHDQALKIAAIDIYLEKAFLS